MIDTELQQRFNELESIIKEALAVYDSDDVEDRSLALFLIHNILKKYTNEHSRND